MLRGFVGLFIRLLLGGAESWRHLRRFFSLPDLVFRLATRHKGPLHGVNVRVVYDADLIASIEERQKSDPMGEASLSALIEKELVTEAGKNEAKKVLL